MLHSIKNWFEPKTNASQDTASDSLQLAAATLMFEVSKADGHVDPIELDTLKLWLKNEFSLSEQSLSDLTDDAEEASKDAISLQGFTRQVCEHFDLTERRRLIEYCWRIALVDNDLDAHERHTIRKIAGLLYLNDKDIILAKEAARAALR